MIAGQLIGPERVALHDELRLEAVGGRLEDLLVAVLGEAALAWLGVPASVLLVVALPVQLAGFFGGRFFDLIWAPMAVFEVVVALWLIIKGTRPGPLADYRAADSASM